MVNKGIILVVDDDRAYGDSLQGILEEEGYIVKTANEGKEALDILERLGSKVDLITLDIEMPGMHGLAFLQRIERVNKKIPIIVASSKKGLKGDISIQGSPQVRKFIGKPYNLDQLLLYLPEVLGSGQPQGYGTPVVVVAEGKKEQRNDLENYFETNGFVVRTASDREALMILLKRLEGRLDAIIADLELLSGQDKWTKVDQETVYLERLESTAPRTPVFLTSDQFRVKDSFSKYSQIQEVLVKPLHLPNLALQIQKLLPGD